MKQKTKMWVASIALSLLSIYVFSQEKQPINAPHWTTDKGYWVVESNIHNPLNHTIWFYNTDRKLVYKEDVNGVKLNPAKRKIKMKLKKVLESSIAAWEEKHIAGENNDLVMAILK